MPCKHHLNYFVLLLYLISIYFNPITNNGIKNHAPYILMPSLVILCC
nr:MAG TPA: hypothetical protein [Caudoviricetes sp.]